MGDDLYGCRIIYSILQAEVFGYLSIASFPPCFYYRRPRPSIQAATVGCRPTLGEEDEPEGDGSTETIRLWVDTSSIAMGARIKSILKDLEHRNACVCLAGNNLELAGNGKPEL